MTPEQHSLQALYCTLALHTSGATSCVTVAPAVLAADKPLVSCRHSWRSWLRPDITKQNMIWNTTGEFVTLEKQVSILPAFFDDLHATESP